MSVFFLILIILAAGLWLWMTQVEVYRFQINRYDVSLRKPLGSPLRILHLSDTHFFKPNPRLKRFYDRLACDEVDLIVVTGDIMDHETGIDFCVETLKKLKSRYGTYAVLGNRDYYDFRLGDILGHNFPSQSRPKRENPTNKLVEALTGGGIRVLRNETIEIQHEGASVLIHGLDDPTTGHASIRETLANYHPKKVNLLLTHSVDAFIDIGEGEIDVSFSGHSHGGQVRLPWIGPIITHTTLGKKYVDGIVDLKGAVCSISRGIGTGRFAPLRLLAPPEAIILTLKGTAT